MSSRLPLTLLLYAVLISPLQAEDQQTLSAPLNHSLEYVLSLPQSEAEFEPAKLHELIKFVAEGPPESSMLLTAQEGASGAFYTFTIKGDLPLILDYVYNPDVPAYITSPASVRDHKWLTPKTITALEELPRKIKSPFDTLLLSGREWEAITPDTNTGGYYAYDQDRMVILLPGEKGPIMVSSSRQNDSSEVGKKGCVVGDDQDWTYLYSGETGLNKMGLGWVNSYMYKAASVVVYLFDSEAQTVKISSFKWLNAGWKKINMVKSRHILKGIKRYASNFKEVMESPGLPTSSRIIGKIDELQQKSDEQLRLLVTPYLESLNSLNSSEVCSNPFKDQLASGDYLKQIQREEIIRIILLEYMKVSIGKDPLHQVASQTAERTTTSVN